MPGHYAHYRFAASQLRNMDGETRKIVDRFRQLYDIGAQGPDPLFCFNPFINNRIFELGCQIHWSPGREFFQRACQTYRAQPTDAAYAYLLGCLTHFCLDSMCHPYVNDVAKSSTEKHVALETEFNRFLMEKDGKTSPHTIDPSGYLTLTRGECATAASFYQGLSGAEFSRSLVNMRLSNKLFAVPEGLFRCVVKKVTEMIGYGGFIMTKGPDVAYCQFNEPMLERYEQAMQNFPGMLAQLRQFLKQEMSLGEEFDKAYG